MWYVTTGDRQDAERWPRGAGIGFNSLLDRGRCQIANTERTLTSSKATYVFWIAGGDDGFVELESSRDHEAVDRIGGRGLPNVPAFSCAGRLLQAVVGQRARPDDASQIHIPTVQ